MKLMEANALRVLARLAIKRPAEERPPAPAVDVHRFRLEDARDLAPAPRLAIRESVLCLLAELCWLTETRGAATVDLWATRVRPTIPRKSAERQFERLKKLLVQWRIPHERIAVDGPSSRPPCGGRSAIGIIMRVSVAELEDLFLARNVRNAPAPLARAA